MLKIKKFKYLEENSSMHILWQKLKYLKLFDMTVRI